MALVLSSASIESGETIRAGHVTQSIKALTGTEAYDITISGSLKVIGPTNLTGSVGISNNLDVVGTLTTGELELTNLTVNGIADIATANIDAGNISASFTGSLLGTAATASNTPNAIVTASVSNNIVTFTKGNNSTFNLTVNSTPDGNDTEIQYNQAGVNFGASSNFTYNYSSDTLTIIGSLNNGRFNLIEGVNSHAEGIYTTASGDYSHAEGSGSWASASYSHAGGIGTKAIYEGTTIVGKYNTTNKGRDTAFEVGTGTRDDNRRTSFKVLTDSGSIVLLVTGSAPTYAGDEGEMIIFSSGGSYRMYVYLNNGWRVLNLS
jgi:hypothetical protein